MSRFSEAELAAIRAMEELIRWLILADRLSAKAQYGSEILASLSQAMEAVSYALNVAKGRT
jgi:hypothetical protein